MELFITWPRLSPTWWPLSSCFPSAAAAAATAADAASLSVIIITFALDSRACQPAANVDSFG